MYINSKEKEYVPMFSHIDRDEGRYKVNAQGTCAYSKDQIVNMSKTEEAVRFVEEIFTRVAYERVNIDSISWIPCTMCCFVESHSTTLSEDQILDDYIGISVGFSNHNFSTRKSFVVKFDEFLKALQDKLNLEVLLDCGSASNKTLKSMCVKEQNLYTPRLLLVGNYEMDPNEFTFNDENECVFKPFI